MDEMDEVDTIYHEEVDAIYNEEVDGVLQYEVDANGQVDGHRLE